jgi:hypothetical protein
MATKTPKIPEEEPNQFLKIMQFQSWFFVGLLILDVLIVMVKSIADKLGLFGAISNYTLLIGLLSMIGAGLSFGLSYQIQSKPDRKKNLFITFYISIGLVGIIAVLVMSAYQF